MNYYYNMSYDEKEDDFFAYIDDGTRKGETIFQIDNTQEIVDYIRTGRMKHIDDVEGLEAFIKEQGFMGPEDTLYLALEMLW